MMARQGLIPPCAPGVAGLSRDIQYAQSDIKEIKADIREFKAYVVMKFNKLYEKSLVSKKADQRESDCADSVVRRLAYFSLPAFRSFCSQRGTKRCCSFLPAASHTHSSVACSTTRTLRANASATRSIAWGRL